jgi:hypothetical protein
VALARCGSVDKVTGGSASGSCTAGDRGRGLGARQHGQHREGQAGDRVHRDAERSTRGRVSTDDDDEGVVSTDDGGTARGGAVGVHRQRRRGGGLHGR